MKVAAQPGLYDPQASVPQLHGTRCGACGSTFFPPLTIGCEICGAGEDHLQNQPLAMAGVLHSLATVHRHAGPDIEAPFTVAEVKLDAGPLVRGVLSESAPVTAIGSKVAAQWLVTGNDEAGNEIVEPRFVLSAGDEQ